MVLSFFLTGAPIEAREIVDMSGRRVDVPDRIKKVYATSPPATYMIYALDPSLLGGLNTPLKETERRYLATEIHSLPVLGGYFGQGQVANTEMILKAKPDVVIMWASHESALNQKMEADMRTLGIPLVLMRIDRVEGYNRGLRFLGRLLNREERAEKLARYGEEALAKAESFLQRIPETRRPSVYYAQGIDGLYTECHTSSHAELINQTGAGNVHRCQFRTGYGMERVSMEQVIFYDPDVIVVQEREALQRINTDKRWRHVKAVKHGRVFIIPKKPFNWFDRPPSFMRYLGIQWLMQCLYPGDYQFDLVEETRNFHRLFLRLELSDEQIREILTG